MKEKSTEENRCHKQICDFEGSTFNLIMLDGIILKFTLNIKQIPFFTNMIIITFFISKYG